MTARKVYLIACDGDGCTEFVLTSHAQAERARVEVISCAGWSTRFFPGDASAKRPFERFGRSIDLCAACSDERPPLGILVDDSKPGRLDVTTLRGPR